MSSLKESNEGVSDYNALNEFVVNCDELQDLESLLGGFNLFSVLGFEYGELRHSNALAWLLTPEESHSLKDLFLKKWLMTVIHEAQIETHISPVEVDCWDLVSVEVHREWKNIDLLLHLKFSSGKSWVIAIENKVNSKQHGNQLKRYRNIVESEFHDTEKRIYIFLTKDDEQAEDEQYIQASYTQIQKCLKSVKESNSSSIGNEPTVLINNYLRLLEEKFMTDSEIATLAQQIYKKHKRALDIIYEQRPDSIKLISDEVLKKLEEQESVLGIEILSSSKSYIKFIPSIWNQRGNSFGSAWTNIEQSVIFELNITPKGPRLYAVSGKNPYNWVQSLWKKASAPPFKLPKANQNKPSKLWFSFHSYSKKIDLENNSTDLEAQATKITKWCSDCLLNSDTQSVIEIVAELLPSLEKAFSESSFTD